MTLGKAATLVFATEESEELQSGKPDGSKEVAALVRDR
jgi:hypothetical protein